MIPQGAPRLWVPLNEGTSDMQGVLGTLLDRGPFVFGVVMLAVLIVAEDIGHRLGRWRATRFPFQEREASNIGAITAGMLTLLAFALGISVSIALERFNARRDLVVTEANAIATAWLDARAIGGPDATEVANLFEAYAKVRLDFTELGKNTAAERALLLRTAVLQSEIWAAVTALVQQTPNSVTATLMQAAGAAFNAATAQREAYESGMPYPLDWALIAGSLLSIGGLGFQVATGGRRQLALTLLLAVMWAGAVLLVTDLGAARLGVVRTNPAPLVWTIQGFSAPAPPPRATRGQSATPERR